MLTAFEYASACVLPYPVTVLISFAYIAELNIKNNIDTPLALEDDVHKGLALALHGRMYDLNRSQVESKFKLLP